MNNHHAADGWRQVNLWCDDWQAAEQMAITHLAPLLSDDDSDALHWWFVRKGPCWRLRLRPVDGCVDTATAAVERITTTLIDRGAIQRWVEVVYEPEIHAFGGVEAMTIAHELFSADSRHLLAHLARTRTDHRRELGLLLGTRLLRAAGQDWYEQGDIWEQVAAHRNPTHQIGEQPRRPSPTTVAAVRQLLTAADDTDDSPLRTASAWPQAFQDAGQAIAELAQQTTLTRGLRAVLAHHLLFSLNRLGMCCSRAEGIAAS
ncbi:MAG: thiopeptide-type bacteriocin biosynthesis protein [Pseudonocardiaceae bacterium]